MGRRTGGERVRTAHRSSRPKPSTSGRYGWTRPRFERQSWARGHQFKTDRSEVEGTSKGEPESPFAAILGQMGIATVTLSGPADLHQIGGFLRLGAVVVIAPHADGLRAWQLEHISERAQPPRNEPCAGLTIQSLARRVIYRGRALPLTKLEFQVLAFLASEPERARSFHEIREAAWGEGPEYPDDVFSVRSTVQRLRRKLREAGVPAFLESVRGFGFRLAQDDSGGVDALRLAPGSVSAEQR